MTEQGGPTDAPPEERGPFDDLLRPQTARSPATPGRGGIVVLAMLALGALLLLLVLPPISLLSRGGGGGGNTPNIKTTARKDVPQLPQGLEAVTAFYDVSVSGKLEGPATITLQLPNNTTDGRNLSAFTLQNSEWQRLTSATLLTNGNAVEAMVSDIPQNIVVLRRSASAKQLIGYLPAGSQISSAAGQALSVANLVDFAPQPDGSLAGSATSASLPAGLPLRATIRVANSDAAAAADDIMASPDLRDEHVNAILAMVESGHYDGVDLDYGSLDALRKDGFSEFVANLSEQLHRRRLVLTLTAPLPVLQGNAWDTGAYDWARLPQIADAIELAPEPDPSRYYKRTEQALQFLIDDSKVAPAKLILRISPLSSEKGGEGITPITGLEALATASMLSVDTADNIRPGQAVTVKATNIDTADGASGIAWDDDAEAVSFTYPGLGGARTVWLENLFSIGFKLEMVGRLGLGGIAIGDVADSVGGDDMWPVIEDFLDTGRVSLVKPNGSLLVPQWEADGGSLEGGSAGSVTWVAPDEPGEYHLTLIISDGVSRVGQRLVLTVRS
jgi:spore germination protein YaaH